MSYKVLGWIVWQVGTRVAKRKVANSRGKFGAMAAVALVLIVGAAAAKAAGGDEE